MVTQRQALSTPPLQGHAQHRTSAGARLRRYAWPRDRNGGFSSLHMTTASVAGILIATVIVAGWRLSGGEGAAVSPAMRSTASIGAGDSVDIVQRITFATARPSLTVSIPTRAAPAGQFDPRIDDLRLRAGGGAVPGLTKPLAKGETHTFTFSEPATSVVLRYSVRGAIAKTQPSVPGRALVLLTPLTIDGQKGLASRVEIQREGVLNLGCLAAGAALTACGSETRQHWVVERIADDPVVDVVAQVDLSEAAAP